MSPRITLMELFDARIWMSESNSWALFFKFMGSGGCATFISVAVINTLTISNLGKEGLIWLTVPQLTMSHSPSFQRREGRNSR